MADRPQADEGASAVDEPNPEWVWECELAESAEPRLAIVRRGLPATAQTEAAAQAELREPPKACEGALTAFDLGAASAFNRSVATLLRSDTSDPSEPPAPPAPPASTASTAASWRAASGALRSNPPVSLPSARLSARPCHTGAGRCV